LSTKIGPIILNIGCNSFFSLVDVNEIDANLEKELEGAFEIDKLMEL
jgi:hypothetical protein